MEWNIHVCIEDFFLMWVFDILQTTMAFQII